MLKLTDNNLVAHQSGKKKKKPSLFKKKKTFLASFWSENRKWS